MKEALACLAIFKMLVKYHDWIPIRKNSIREALRLSLGHLTASILEVRRTTVINHRSPGRWPCVHVRSCDIAASSCKDPTYSAG